MLQDFRRDITVTADLASTWQKLLDVSTVASWVSIVEDVKEIDPLRRFTAVLQDRMGPFKLRADLSIDVLEIEEGSRIRIKAGGQDRQVRSRISVEAELSIENEENGSRVTVEGTYEVTGRVATLGAGSIRKKATGILDEFFQHLTQELGGSR
ncbi:MAG: hypothetical protein GEU71_06780 [Actinobacteria bacterium]|nr:hypothetical protein [Actinomycetota bacterium]